MAKFLGRPARLLDSLYNFVGGLRGLSNFSLEGSIQPVHDFSREAELAAAGDGRGGVWYARIKVTANGSTVEAELDPYDRSGPTNKIVNGYKPELSEWVWVTGAYFNISGTGVAARASLRLSPSSGDLYYGIGNLAAIDQQTRLIRYWPGQAVSGSLTEDSDIFTQLDMPILCPRGMKIVALLEESGGTNDCRGVGTLQLWIGKVGVFPPGLS